MDDDIKAILTIVLSILWLALGFGCLVYAIMTNSFAYGLASVIAGFHGVYLMNRAKEY